MSGDRQYLEALSENGSFGDVVSLAYDLIQRLEAIEALFAVDNPAAWETRRYKHYRDYPGEECVEVPLAALRAVLPAAAATEGDTP